MISSGAREVCLDKQRPKDRSQSVVSLLLMAICERGETPRAERDLLLMHD